MNIYFGIPSAPQINHEEMDTSKRLVSALSNLPCHTRDFTTDDPYPFEAVSGTPSLIHAFNLSKAGIQCLKLANKARLPLIVSCSGLDVYADLFNPALKHQLQDVISNAARIIVPFAAMAKFIKTRLQPGANIEVISPSVIPQSLDFDFPRQHFGLNDGDRIVMLEGGLLPVKNTIFAIHTIAKIISEYGNLKLVILADPCDKEYRLKIEDEISDKPWVTLLDRPEAELQPFLYKMADLFINVSHVEGYNPSVLNAMLAGRPVLASDIPGNSAYVRNENIFEGSGTGYLYSTSPGPEGYEKIHDAEEFIEKLRFLLNNPEQAKIVGERAEITIKKSFNVQKELYLHLQLYKNILK